MCQSDNTQELTVTFNPQLYLQRRGWVLDIMRREGITEVLDIGCGEGELLACLCNPAPWLAPPPPHVFPPAPSADTARAPQLELTSLHKDILHPVKVAGLDVSRADLAAAVEATCPPEPGSACVGLWHEPVRWEPLEVEIWEGSLARVNPAFVDVECVVSTEVIEHLPEDVLPAFAPVVFGVYHPRIVLLTTPSYTFNARFTAPDAPLEARSGWPDPTKRTARIFRHSDHKFEWTVEEFTEWCRAVAQQWGYEVELSGVGKAQEVDEWGRDDALGWASQTAVFTRREGTGWADRRARRVSDLGILHEPHKEAEHTLLATHQYTAHEAASCPQPLQIVGDLIVEQMVHVRYTSMSIRDLWFDNAVAIACGGWLEWLVRAIQMHNGLSLDSMTTDEDTLDWTVLLDPSLHELIPPEAEASPPDSDEVLDSWDPLDEDDAWRNGAVAIASNEQDGATDNMGWGQPDVGWDKSPADDLEGEVVWGVPEDNCGCSSVWT
ncbi:hypothetical protein PYCCODRAFT_1383447 [Trametes coccinea BRFM310]|uniref:Small RNA 2'-O-methyltransferase n=1 Tax=Trametes coccinea (strain BRFM310) TaxID=1353009 RepID=A0A1Y2IZ58_TRAC3|nr:hypothetical protein PYCCODRAFT_1383447 [Trametes coccinea BRFM310]